MTVSKRVTMVMAMDRNGLIGSKGGLPWHIPSEMQYFKSVTMGKPMIMGRLTFESIGKPLPGRTSIVVTRNPEWSEKGVLVTHSLEQALKLANDVKPQSGHTDEELPEVAIIGGASLCREAMPVTEKLYLTVIDGEFEGDVWLDSYHENEWRTISSTKAQADGYEFEYKVLVRQ